MKKNLLESGIVYGELDVLKMFGLKPKIERMLDVPEARPGELIVYYGGWNLPELQGCLEGGHLWGEVFKHLSYSSGVSGYYSIRHFTQTCGRTWAQSLAVIDKEGWRPAPVAVMTVALLMHWITTKEDLFGFLSEKGIGYTYRCAETTDFFHHVAPRIHPRGPGESIYIAQKGDEECLYNTFTMPGCRRL